MNTVVDLPRPRKVRHNYRDHEIILTFDTAKRTWCWQFEHKISTTLTGDAPTLEIALKNARKEVDIIEGPKLLTPSPPESPNKTPQTQIIQLPTKAEE